MFAVCSSTVRTLARHAKRNASTATHPFPFPTSSRPTPHQIFHLPTNASESDIKARYIDLVRIYHPDKVGNSVSPDVAHARFQSITAAYDILRKKQPLSESDPVTASSSQEVRYSAAAARHARAKREKLYSGGSEELWKDRIILGGVIVTVVIFVGQTFATRKQALAEAVARTRHSGSRAEKSKEAPVVITTLNPDHSDRRLGA